MEKWMKDDVAAIVLTVLVAAPLVTYGLRDVSAGGRWQFLLGALLGVVASLWLGAREG